MTTAAEMTNMARSSAHLSLLCALYVLYRQDVRGKIHQTNCVETGNHQPTTKHERHNHTHEFIFTTSFFLCTHLLNNTTQEAQKRTKDFTSQNFSGRSCTSFSFSTLDNE